MARPPRDEKRCVPCDDGRRLLIAALIARLGWGLATRRLAAGAEPASPAPWLGLAASAAAPVLAYRLGINLRLPRAAALAAGVVLAVSPGLVDAGTRGGAEAYLPLTAAAVLVAWVYAWQSGKLRAAALAGLCGGAAAWAGAAVLPAAGAFALVAAWRRREQPRWIALLAAALVAGALAAAPRAALVRPAPAEPLTKWSAPLAVVPAAGADARAVRDVFAFVLLVAALLGARAAVRGPGGWFVLAWLLAAAASRYFHGGRSLSEDPALAVIAGAGLCGLGLASD